MEHIWFAWGNYYCGNCGKYLGKQTLRRVYITKKGYLEYRWSILTRVKCFLFDCKYNKDGYCTREKITLEPDEIDPCVEYEEDPSKQYLWRKTDQWVKK